MELRERGKQRRVERALAAAREILIEEGIGGLQMRALAERAELSVRTLYNQFGSKAEVVTALASRALDELATELEGLALEDGLDLSRAVISVSIARFHAERELLRPLWAATYFGGAAEGAALLHAQARALQEHALGRAMAARQLEETVPARHLAHQVLASYNQAAIRWAAGDIDHRAFETQAVHAWACLLLGLARGPARVRLLEEIAAQERGMERVVRDRERAARAH